jgi:orotate phosphoribosyltransferase
VQEVQALYNMPVYAIANLGDLMVMLDTSQDTALAQYKELVQHYRSQYGI